jgi:hypothetical protein
VVEFWRLELVKLQSQGFQFFMDNPHQLLESTLYIIRRKGESGEQFHGP